MAMSPEDPINTFPKPSVKPLRFKSDTQTHRGTRDDRYDTHHRRHRKHHQRKSRTSNGEKEGANTHARSTDPESAFRESLFDALADDEGAEYWENVYGQPIHTYASTYEEEDGGIRAMTDEEYVEHVRSEMWKKTHKGLLEERERRNAVAEEARKAKEEQERAAREAWKEHKVFTDRVEASLKKGRLRDQKKREDQAVERYTAAWKHFEAATQDTVVEVPWPTMTGSVKEVSKAHVENFMECVARRQHSGDLKLVGFLKKERVRWHPDKMQQRARGQLDDSSIKMVTAVFQLIDDMWVRYRKD